MGAWAVMKVQPLSIMKEIASDQAAGLRPAGPSAGPAVARNTKMTPFHANLHLFSHGSRLTERDQFIC